MKMLLLAEPDEADFISVFGTSCGSYSCLLPEHQRWTFRGRFQGR
ncbi:hypothetical protein ACNAW0_02770 [Micromonospora sp. SL1-18]